MTEGQRKVYLIGGTIGLFVVLFGGFLFIRGLWDGLDDKDQQINALTTTKSNNATKLAVLGRDKRLLDQRRATSLPPDDEIVRTSYGNFIRAMGRRSRLQIQRVNDGGLAVQAPSTAKNAKFYTPYTFTVTAKGTLGELVSFLQRFYETNLLHQIRKISITTVAAKGESKEGSPKVESRLNITLTIEALSMTNAPARDYLLPRPDVNVAAVESLAALYDGPTGVATALWLVSPTGTYGARKLAASYPKHDDRDYSRVVIKNPFLGLEKVVIGVDRKVLLSIQLASITSDSAAAEALLRNVKTKSKIRLRTESPYDKLEVKDDKGNMILRGKVKAIGEKQVEFVAGEKCYRLSMGQSLYEALQGDKISEREWEQLALTPKTIIAKSP
jgi:hypothetical protein